jgi:GNAT superfamily N-acetyltransferase
MSSSLSVRPVSSEAEYQAFLRMPWKVYKDNPNWTAPLWKEHVHFFDPAHNPELKHIDHQKFVAWRGSEPVGTVIAHINHAYNNFQGENTGWFGQFELINDSEVGAALLSTAEDWVRAKGVNKMMGPGTYSTNSEIGLLIKGHESPTMILMPYHQPYYQGFVEACGFTKSMDLFAWYVNAEKVGGRNAEHMPERLTRLAAKLRERKNFTTRLVNMKKFDEEIATVKKIYNQAWAKNWGFIPFTDEEIDHLAEGLKVMVDPKIVVWVEREGEPVAFGIPMPDVNQPMRAAKMKPGEPEWWQLLKLIWHWKVATKPTGVRVWAMGILEEYRGSGVDAIMYYELLQRGLKRGYQDIEMSWILENNDMMNRGIQNFTGEIYKIYRVYEKAL